MNRPHLKKGAKGNLPMLRLAMLADISSCDTSVAPPQNPEFTYKKQEPLHGKRNYRIHFEKGQLPPAQTFWSYTVYDKDRYLVDNPILRYAIGDRNDLKYNKDSSLNLYLSPEAPEKDKISNWVPTSHDEFNVTLRVYIPVAEHLKNLSSWYDSSPEKIN
jgi:hypothetical protein